MEGPRTLTRKEFELVFNHFVQNILPWATPGPWDYDNVLNSIKAKDGKFPIADVSFDAQQGCTVYERDANAELLTLSRNVIPALLDTLKYGFAGEVNAKKTSRTRKSPSIRD